MLKESRQRDDHAAGKEMEKETAARNKDIIDEQ
jgi:hypothetical protein